MSLSVRRPGVKGEFMKGQHRDPDAALRELARIEEANWKAAWEEWGKKEKGEGHE